MHGALEYSPSFSVSNCCNTELTVENHLYVQILYSSHDKIMNKEAKPYPSLSVLHTGKLKSWKQVKYDVCFHCRVLLDLSKSSSPVIAERVLLQPFGLMLAVERNLTPSYTKIPTIFININMGEFKIYLGQDDLEELAKFGADVGAKVTTALQTMGRISFYVYCLM